MKNVRFYEEFENKRKGISEGNVMALVLDADNTPMFCPDGSMEVLTAVYFHPNSDVAMSAVSRTYLNTKCKRISEAKARLIHPRLFERLDLFDFKKGDH